MTTLDERLLLAADAHAHQKPGPEHAVDVASAQNGHASAASGTPKIALTAKTVAVPTASRANAHDHHHTSPIFWATSTISRARTSAHHRRRADPT